VPNFFFQSKLFIHNLCTDLTPKLKGGSQCVSSARWDLCEGCRETGIPTVTHRKDLQKNGDLISGGFDRSNTPPKKNSSVMGNFGFENE
jgi:hypothetical protein